MAFGRIIQATIGPPAKNITPSAPPSGTNAPQGVPTAQQGQTIQNLHMNFKVKKSLGRGASISTAELKIYNMSLKSYFNFVKINYFLGIAVGYQDEMASALMPIPGGAGGGTMSSPPLVLFSGAIRFCRRYREKADWMVYIEADGGMWDIGGAPYTVSMQPGISVYSLLANLSSSMNLSIRNLSTVPQGVVYSGGFSFIGRVWDFVQTLCNFIGFNFLIDGGEIILIPPASVQTTPPAPPSGGAVSTGTPTSTTGMLISKETGLLQAPEPEQISIGVPDATAQLDGGSQSLPEMRWKIDSLLLPQVGPGEVMLVKSQNFASGQAYMMVEEIEYDGDNRIDDFKMEARCIPVDSAGAQTAVQVA